jgi:hypothetical protein
MQTSELLEFTIPEWAVCALINGDDSGLNETDLSVLNSFVEQTVKEYGNANFMLGDESEFSEFRCSNDIVNEGGTVCTLYLMPSINI